MPVSFSTVKAGDVLYDCHLEKVGNTTASQLGVWEVYVREVYPDGALVSWNGNTPRRVYVSYFRSLRRHPPEWIPQAFRVAYCAVCHRNRDQGHHETCAHPRAIASRKAAGK